MWENNHILKVPRILKLIAQRFWDCLFQYNILCVVHSAEEAKPAIRGPNISARLSTNAVAVLRQAMSADCQGKLSAIHRSLFTSPADIMWDHLLACKKVAHILWAKLSVKSISLYIRQESSNGHKLFIRICSAMVPHLFRSHIQPLELRCCQRWT